MSGHRSRGHGEAQLANEPLALERIAFFSDAVIAITITAAVAVVSFIFRRRY